VGNLKRVLISLFGATAGQRRRWYTGQFYALFYLQTILKVNTKTAISSSPSLCFALCHSSLSLAQSRTGLAVSGSCWVHACSQSLLHPYLQGNAERRR